MSTASVISRLSWLAGSAIIGLGFAAVLLVLAPLAASPAAAALAPEPAQRAAEGLSASLPVTCTPETITYTRYVDAWYGSTFVLGADVTNVTELSDHATGTLATAIFNDSRQDARVRNGLGPWLTTTVDISWTLATGENLPAAASLRAALAGVAPPSPLTAIHLDQPISHGAFTYNLTNWITGDGGCIVQNRGDAEVAYFEQNARAVELVYLPLARR